MDKGYTHGYTLGYTYTHHVPLPQTLKGIQYPCHCLHSHALAYPCACHLCVCSITHCLYVRVIASSGSYTTPAATASAAMVTTVMLRPLQCCGCHRCHQCHLGYSGRMSWRGRCT